MKMAWMAFGRSDFTAFTGARVYVIDEIMNQDDLDH
jgi:hypothetical protein